MLRLAYKQLCCLNLAEVICLNASKGFKVAQVDGIKTGLGHTIAL